MSSFRLKAVLDVEVDAESVGEARSAVFSMLSAIRTDGRGRSGKPRPMVSGIQITWASAGGPKEGVAAESPECEKAKDVTE